MWRSDCAHEAAHRQDHYRVRFEWGECGAAAVAGDADVVVVVDVLSFTTTLSVALDVGIAVHPYPCNDDSAERFADELGACGRAVTQWVRAAESVPGERPRGGGATGAAESSPRSARA